MYLQELYMKSRYPYKILLLVVKFNFLFLLLYKINKYYIVIVIVIFIWWSPFIPSRNLDEVFTYNHIWL